MIKINPLSSGSKGNAYIVSDGVTALLIECGISVKDLQKGTGFGLSKLGGVLVSHQHNDHCKSVNELAKMGLDIYAPLEVFELKKSVGHRFKSVKPFDGFNVGTFFILPFDCEHDVVNYGYLVCSKQTGERLLYFTDTRMVRYKFDGLTHIMAECNYCKEALEANNRIPQSLKSRIIAGHMSVDNLLKYFAANFLTNVKEIYLIHMSESHGRAENFKSAVEKQTGKKVFVCL